ncbi:DUF1217 domain-containing protein [Puniceibacterium confluentis]|uniref:DUF1217 domain-containing protein n=1 Tax=Puniceibacterium confluentis TaxID=1958944 RepID=UPI0011B74B32|nr:DUF1217 domain-containing protein [Puniceibacterium confluentis]
MGFSPIVSGTGLIGWEFLNRTREKQQAAFAQSPSIARDSTRFAEQIQGVQTSEQLMDNHTLLRVALGAFGLDEDVNNRAFIKQVLDSDLTDGASLANRLADKRYLRLAEAFNFAGSDGPKIGGAGIESELIAKLDNLSSAEDLLLDRKLLRATLAGFGLDTNLSNAYFLQQVLESDLADPASFANRLSDKRYVELARTFDFHSKSQAGDDLYGFSRTFTDRLADLETAEDLLDDPDLLDSALRIFGLEKDFANLDRPDFLLNVLNSDPYDGNSFATQLEDKRYLALSNAFGFGDSGTETSKAEKLISRLNARTDTVEQVSDLFNDIGLTLAVMDFFNLPQGEGKITLARRIVGADRSDPNALINVYPDRRYHAFANAFDFKEKSDTRSYSQGFVAAIVGSYHDRQFENEIGESDTNMRIALSMERDLSLLVDRGGSGDTQWFSVMASAPLRSVFETAFGLPSSFGALDVDQQLVVFKDRSERMFGTDRVADFADPDMLDQLRRRFLLISDQNSAQSLSSGGGVVLALLSGAAG